MITPEALGTIAGVLIARVVSHAFGFGEVIDLVVMTMGVASIGWAVFDGIDHLYEFADRTYRAKSLADLELASTHLAQAFALLGVQAVLAVLFRGAKAPSTWKGTPLSPGRAPPRTPGVRYKPKVSTSPNLAPGNGLTDWWGDITMSTMGTATDRALALLHERVHQALVPKFVGIRFPVQNGYVYLVKGGSSLQQAWAGSGLVTEAAALIHTGMVAGISIQRWFAPTPPPTVSGRAAR